MDEEIEHNSIIEQEKNERFKKLGYKPQKELLCNKHLPYADKLDEESQLMLNEIKDKLGTTLAIRDFDGISIITSKLQNYIRLYGLKFSKDDHVKFIKVYLELLVIHDLGFTPLNQFCKILSTLLKKSYHLSPNDIEIDWKPLNELAKKILYKSETKGEFYRHTRRKKIDDVKEDSVKGNLSLFQSAILNTLAAKFGLNIDSTNLPDIPSLLPVDSNLSFVIQQCALYFPLSATHEILDEFYPKLEILENGKVSVSFEMLSMFLNPVNGYEIWLDDFLNLWTYYNNGPFATDLMHLISKTASHNIGFIDWEPHIPTMFARIMRSIDLPVTYKGIKSSKKPNYFAGTVGKWIISTLGPNSSTQKYLSKLMVVIESYLHPANSGKWVSAIGDLLVSLHKNLVDRLTIERYKPLTWKRQIPDSHKLTEDCITAFVECMKPIALQAMYSRMNTNDVGKIFKILADLRPHLILDDVLDRVTTTLESVTEPHKMTAALQCLISVSRAMVSGSKGYTSGKTSAIPILFSTLPGIDANDFRKTTVTLQFLTSFAFFVPLVDCSKAGSLRDDLTEEEHTICCHTADFENFVLLFLEKLFNLINASSVQNIRMEQSDTDLVRSKMESIAEIWITSTIHAILGQCSDEILNSASEKFITFVQTNLFEPKVAGMLVTALMRIFTRVAAKKTLHALVPFIVEKLEVIINDNNNITTLEKQSDEFLYYLTLLVGITRGGDPNEVIKNEYKDLIISIIDKVIYFKCKQTQKLGNNILTYYLINVSCLQTLDVKSIPDSYKKSLKEFLPIRHWGAKMKPNDRIEWYFNKQKSFEFCEYVIQRYLFPVIIQLNQFISDEIQLDKDDLNHMLSIINSLLKCSNYLPNWNENDEKPLNLVNTKYFLYRPKITNGFGDKWITMPDGANVRITIIKLISKLQEKLLKTREDDISSFKHIINIWDKVHIQRHSFNNYDTQLKHFHNIKNFQDYPFTRFKRDIRTVVATRVLLQHDLREECNRPNFTESHRTIFLSLLKLSTSRYSEIRIQSQLKLSGLLKFYPYSYRVVADQLVENLKLDPNEHHDSFKGTLYVIAGPRTAPLFLKHDWDFINRIWIGFLNTNLSEKPSIVALLDYLTDLMNQELTTITLKIEISKEIEVLGLNLITESSTKPSLDDIEKGKLELFDESNRRYESFQNTMNSILDIINRNDIHWRYHFIGSSMLYNMDHPQTKYNGQIAKYFLENLIHDSIDERKLSIQVLIFIFKHEKREHKKRIINPFTVAGVEKPKNKKLSIGIRPDNKFLQYNIKTVPKNQKEWDEPRYACKANGFFGWPSKFEVYCPTAEQPSIDRKTEELNDVTLEIYKFFDNPTNIERLVYFWSLEERKGKDKYNRARYVMIKCLFNEFGDLLLDNFLTHLTVLIESKTNTESNHRCAGEILAGIIRGAKHWNYQKTEKLFIKLQTLIRLVFNNITTESENFWGTCFATSTEHMDPNRQHWLHEVLMEDFFSDKLTSYISCSKIYCFQGSFAQHIWRMNSAGHRVLNYVKPYLSHSFQNVRERIGSLLINLFDSDFQFPGSNEPEGPRIKDLINELKPKLEILFEEPPKKKSLVDMKNENQVDKKSERDEKYEEGVRIFKTVSQFITGFLNRTGNVNRIEFFELLPLACRLERSEDDAELAEVTTSLLAMMALAHTYIDTMEFLLNKINEVSLMPFWSARVSILEFLQAIIFHNMPIVLSQKNWVSLVKSVVLRLLEDTSIEVREKAAQVLGGLIHCSFLPASDELLEQFKRKCQTKIIKSPKGVKVATSSNLVSVTDGFPLETREAHSIRERHIGVLGLCAFISAYPYDIPEIVPKAFEQLGAHLNDPQPIPTTIRKTVGNFKRTHQDNWATLQLKLTEDQLAVLSDVDVPPSYYA